MTDTAQVTTTNSTIFFIVALSLIRQPG
jgi:hypothetical protein